MNQALCQQMKYVRTAAGLQLEVGSIFSREDDVQRFLNINKMVIILQ